MATPTPVDLSSFTAEQKKLFAGANALGTGVQTYNSANPGATLNANTLQGSPSLTTPPVSTPVTPPAAPPVNFGVQQAQTDYDSTLKDLEAALGQAGQVTARTQQLESQAGIPQLDSRLNELYGLDAGYVADLSSIASQQLQGTASQQGTATSEVGRRVDLKDLNYNAVIAQQNVNIKRATNNAVIASVQGQLANAQQNVQRALELEFKPLEAKIDYLKEFARINAGRLSDKENAQLQYQITQREQAYQEGVQNKKDIYAVMLEAAKNGADTQTLAAIQSAMTPAEAIAAANASLQAKPTLDFINGTQYQPAGYFNSQTGEFTRTGGGGGGVGGGGAAGGGGGGVGGAGTLSPLSQAVVTNPSLFFTYTPTQKAKITTELQAAGYDISNLTNAKLSPGQEDDIAQMNTVSGLIDQVVAYNSDGTLSGIGPFGLGTLKQLGAQAGIGTAEGKSVRALIGNIQATIAKLRGGTSFTANEQALLNTYVPTINDSAAVALTKLANLQGFIKTKNTDLLQAATLNITKGQITKKGDGKVEDLRVRYNY